MQARWQHANSAQKNPKFKLGIGSRTFLLHGSSANHCHQADNVKIAMLDEILRVWKYVKLREKVMEQWTVRSYARPFSGGLGEATTRAGFFFFYWSLLLNFYLHPFLIYFNHQPPHIHLGVSEPHQLFAAHAALTPEGNIILDAFICLGAHARTKCLCADLAWIGFCKLNQLTWSASFNTTIILKYRSCICCIYISDCPVFDQATLG